MHCAHYCVRESDDGACEQLTLKQLLNHYVEQGLDAKPKPSEQKRSAATPKQLVSFDRDFERFHGPFRLTLQ